MKTQTLPALLALAALAPAARAQEARPFLSPMFSDHMVLQRNRPVPVWGWSAPGAKVTVSLNGKSATATAGEDGRWMARLPSMKEGGPYSMTVAAAPQSVTLSDVLIGDVWLASGQSNMEMGIQGVRNAQQEIAQANYPQIRLYTVPHKTSLDPEWDPHGSWLVCTPENIQKGTWGGFSAAAYFFGRDLYQHLKIPIGLLHTSWGGTPAEAWTSAEALQKYGPDFRGALAQEDQLREAVRQGNYNYDAQMANWWTKNDPGTSGAFQAPDLDTAAWKSMDLPQPWDNVGMKDYDGVVWYRREINLPDSVANQAATLSLGPIDDADTTWINGTQVGATERYDAPRTYAVPAGVLKPGRNVIAVRVLDIASTGGFTGTPQQMSLDVKDGTRVPLAGAWRYQPTVELSKATPIPQRLDDNPGRPTVLYNGMIAPVIPYAIKGVIWYQGEGNAPAAYQYRTLLPAMIADWRNRWHEGDFPFLVVQIANYMERLPQPAESDWAELREAQALTAKNGRNIGLAVTIDIGEAADIHPKNKQEVGRRLALAAERIAYGEKSVVASGPTYKAMKVEGSTIRLSFDNVDGGLKAEGGNPAGFAVAGPDGKFVWASARIDGNTVVVSSPDVSKPVAVRYAWANNPEATLYNAAGLPAVPFRTDNFRLTTQK